jgi:hypothetical protein
MTGTEIERLVMLARLYRRIRQDFRASVIERQLANERDQALVAEVVQACGGLTLEPARPSRVTAEE